MNKKCNDYCYERYPYKRSILPNGQGAILPKSFQDTIAIAGIKRTIDEACDLLYHVLVLLSSKNISSSEIEKELKLRLKKYKQ